MEQEDIVSVNTPDGPSEIRFKGLGPLPLQKKKIEKKEKKEKKHHKKKHTQEKNTFNRLDIPLVILSLITIPTFYYYLTTAPNNIQSHIKLFELAPFGFNTTSVKYDKEISIDYVKNILLHYNHQPLICMHHIKLSTELYQICLLERTYLLINPHVRFIKNTNITEISELSISCLKEQPQKRFECVAVDWTDSFYNFSSTFCGNVAMHLQMMKDEFEGNKHCLLIS